MKKLSPLITDTFIAHLTTIAASLPAPLVETMIIEYGHNPFIILISCLLSLRARDVVTVHVCRELFNQIQTPAEFVAIEQEDLEKIIYRSGFYRAKARTLKEVSATLLQQHNGQVPSTEAELLALPGVGQKTANLVLGLAFNVPAICVDTHVHRISNMWGVVNTKTPNDTEKALKKVVPQKHWIAWNMLLVVIGQNMKREHIKALTGKPILANPTFSAKTPVIQN
jgi:endonuclease III